MNEYQITISVEHFIPPDVLVEHIAVALRDLHFTGKSNITMDNAPTHWSHPFDGPEVFDDTPKPELATGGYTGTHNEGHYTPVGIVHKGDRYIPKAAVEMMGLDALEKLIEASRKPVDPYPNVTEAAMQLKEARRERE